MIKFFWICKLVRFRASFPFFFHLWDFNIIWFVCNYFNLLFLSVFDSISGSARSTIIVSNIYMDDGRRGYSIDSVLGNGQNFYGDTDPSDFFSETDSDEGDNLFDDL